MIVNEILNKAGLNVKYDNRNKKAKSIETLITTFNLDVRLAKIGKYFEDKKGKKYDLRITMKGKASRKTYNKNNMSRWSSDTFLDYIQREIGNLLSFANENNLINNNKYQECDKCGGGGKLNHYHYYAEGVCFQCMGSGLMKKVSIV